MKTVSVGFLAKDASAFDVAIIFDVMATINSRHKNGFKAIWQSLYYDARMQPQTFFVAYDQRSMDEFSRMVKAEGAGKALELEWVWAPRYRHYLDVQENGRIVMHWHPKDTLVEVDPELVNMKELVGPGYGGSGIYPQQVFFVGPNRETEKAHRRYLNRARHLKHFNLGMTYQDLIYITEPMHCGGEFTGGAMYIVNHTGLVARVTSTRFEWVKLRPEVGPEERRARGAHGYLEKVLAAGRDWSSYKAIARPGMRANEPVGFITSMHWAAATQEVVTNLTA